MSEPYFWWTDEQKELDQKVSQFVSDHLEEAESYFWKKKISMAACKESGC